MNLPQQIIIVEDEAITQRYLKSILEEHGVEKIDCFDNAVDAMKAVNMHMYDMVLMDINIKGSTDGIQLSRDLLEKYIIPIVFISAYNDDETLEEVLELSPYGFISKPFTSDEVLASLKVAYKRFLTFEQINANKADNNTIQITKNYTYSTERSKLYFNGESVILNAKQNLFIRLLVKNINSTVSFEELISYIWHEDEVSDSSLRTLVYSIRKILPDFPLHTHSKHGYYLSNQ